LRPSVLALQNFAPTTILTFSTCQVGDISGSKSWKDSGKEEHAAGEFRGQAILLYERLTMISPILGEAEYNAAQAKQYVEGVSDRVTGLHRHPKCMAAS
jgi:uncharacterized protein YjbJ (UPF0337 family)